MHNSEFKDYPADKIAAKLKEVTDFEAKYGESTRTIAYKKWCTDYDYRKREWQFRQSVAASIKPNVNYTKPYYNDQT
tara:strand:- start:49 stop:279 length:231 start_codon:yes stop_codon:yes gene_type:complete